MTQDKEYTAMAKDVVMGAMMQCSFGMAPSPLIVLPVNRVMVDSKPATNIMDNKPGANIPLFGMCTTQSNPAGAVCSRLAHGNDRQSSGP